MAPFFRIFLLVLGFGLFIGGLAHVNAHAGEGCGPDCILQGETGGSVWLAPCCSDDCCPKDMHCPDLCRLFGHECNQCACCNHCDCDPNPFPPQGVNELGSGSNPSTALPFPPLVIRDPLMGLVGMTPDQPFLHPIPFFITSGAFRC